MATRKRSDSPSASASASPPNDPRQGLSPADVDSTGVQLPNPWLDDLLRLSLSMPVESGAAAVVTCILDALAQLVPSLSVGVCVVSSPSANEPLIAKRMPAGSTADEGRDPTRLFPSACAERVVAVEDGTGGSTLHIAGDNAEAVADGSLGEAVAARGASILAAGLRRSWRFQQARDARAEFERLQAHVIQAEKLASLGQIVAGVVHELNNPLTSIVAYSDYLKKKALAKGDPGDAERLKRISEAAQRILKFSRDLVAYSRPASGVPGPVQLEEVVEKALVFCEHEFTQSRVQVEREYDAVVPPVQGVSGQLTQVFVNLFTNAAHAMSRSGGRLRIVMHKDPEARTVLARVSDEGVGIPPDDFDRIFEPFFTTKADGRGAGLGLSIVKDIIAAHGGSLDAASTPGEGSEFCITLPLAAAATRKSP